MKTCFLLAFAICISTSLQADPLTQILMEQAVKQSGREALEVGAREAVEHAAASAIRHVGEEGAEKLVKQGGLELLEAASRHGDEVMLHAARVPEAAHYIAARPVEALDLARRLGDDALRLEARAPGMAEQAAAQFGRNELAVLSRAAPEDVVRLSGYAARADSPATRAELLQSWKKNGSALLTKLDQHKVLILTGGLTASMIKLANDTGNAIQQMPQRIPVEAMTEFFSKAGTGVSTALILVSVTLSLALVWLLRSRRRTHKRPTLSPSAPH